MQAGAHQLRCLVLDLRRHEVEVQTQRRQVLAYSVVEHLGQQSALCFLGVCQPRGQSAELFPLLLEGLQEPRLLNGNGQRVSHLTDDRRLFRPEGSGDLGGQVE